MDIIKLEDPRDQKIYIAADKILSFWSDGGETKISLCSGAGVNVFIAKGDITKELAKALTVNGGSLKTIGA